MGIVDGMDLARSVTPGASTVSRSTSLGRKYTWPKSVKRMVNVRREVRGSNEPGISRPLRSAASACTTEPESRSPYGVGCIPRDVRTKIGS